MTRRSSTLLLAVVLLAGCGSDDSSTDSKTEQSVARGVTWIDDVQIDAKDRELRWAEVDDAASYRVAVLDSGGTSLWAGSSDEPSLTIPAHVMLPNKGSYVVAALDDEQHVLASGASRA
jgi:hypothetical protein